MRKVKLNSWKEQGRDGNELDVDITTIFTTLINNRPPEKTFHGLDNFRLMRRISKAFDDARNSKVLKLEEGDYSFLKKLLEEDIPAAWATIPGVQIAIDAFISAPQE